MSTEVAMIAVSQAKRPLFLGFDVGGTNIKLGVVDDAGRPVVSTKIATEEEKGPREAVKRARAAVEEMMAGVGLAIEDLAGIGLAVPGTMDIPRGIFLQPHNLPHWHYFNIRDCVAETFGVPTAFANDANAAAYGEFWVGSGQKHHSIIMLTLGTGVGGGIIVDGRVLQGATGRAGHVGHITLDGRGKPDIVGMPGSLEDAIGNHNIAARSGGRFTSTAALLEAVSTADEVAAQCWQTSIRELAVGVASLINAFDPEVVVLGGGIAECGAALFTPLQRELDQVEWRPTGVGVPFVPAQLGEFAGAIGAARFAMLKNEEESPR
jgi:glucokinase